MESVLKITKKMLGVDEDYEVFDTDILAGINSAMVTLNQIGVGPEDPMIVFDESAMWSDFSDNPGIVALAKQYVYCKTKMIFDTPSTSFVIEAINKQIEELEWRLSATTYEHE